MDRRELTIIRTKNNKIEINLTLDKAIIEELVDYLSPIT